MAITIATTFTQVVGPERLVVSIPVTRLDRVIDKVDALIEQGKIQKARTILTPFVINGDEKPATKPKVAAKPVDKRSAAMQIIADHGTLDRTALIKMIQTDLDCTYANAYYYVRVANK